MVSNCRLDCNLLPAQLKARDLFAYFFLPKSSVLQNFRLHEIDHFRSFWATYLEAHTLIYSKSKVDFQVIETFQTTLCGFDSELEECYVSNANFLVSAILSLRARKSLYLFFFRVSAETNHIRFFS